MAPLAFHEAAAIQWLTEAATYHTGFEVEISNELTADAAVDRIEGRIEVRAGLSLPRFHIAIGRSILFTLFDEAAAPEFRNVPRELPSGVIPFPPAPRRHGQFGLSLSS
ncbi:MAG: hypothetical protein JWO67_4523 [Streptosporangiaceae bacterium]|nr:hypothetical protein [Streptosporangiaceae bacterium]